MFSSINYVYHLESEKSKSLCPVPLWSGSRVNLSCSLDEIEDPIFLYKDILACKNKKEINKYLQINNTNNIYNLFKKDVIIKTLKNIYPYQKLYISKGIGYWLIYCIQNTSKEFLGVFINELKNIKNDNDENKNLILDIIYRYEYNMPLYIPKIIPF